MSLHRTAVFLALVLSGCGASLDPTTYPQPIESSNKATESSIAFLTLVAKSFGPPYIQEPTVFQLVDSDQAVGAILDAHWGGPKVTVHQQDEAVSIHDDNIYADYDVVMLYNAAESNSGVSRITSVENQPSHLVVHAQAWDAEGAGSERSSYHLVAIPKLGKPITFAPIKNHRLVEGQVPRWTAVQNPQLSRDHMAQGFRDAIGSNSIESFSFELRSLDWVKANLHKDIFSASNWTSDSNVWVGIAVGSISQDGFLQESQNNVGVPRAPNQTGRRVVAIYSIENGEQLSIDFQFN